MKDLIKKLLTQFLIESSIPDYNMVDDEIKTTIPGGFTSAITKKERNYATPKDLEKVENEYNYQKLKIEKQIETAINGAIDFDKLNESLPKLYYANCEFFKITKADLVEIINQ
jgi:hypothetical protein